MVRPVIIDTDAGFDDLIAVAWLLIHLSNTSNISEVNISVLVH